MKKLLSVAFILSAIISAESMAGPKCTNESANTWQDQNLFKKQLMAKGYAIKKFKVTQGNCYEMYGRNGKGQKVEIYYNPISGDKVKEEIED